MLALAVVLIARPRLRLIDEMSMGLAPLIMQSLLPVIRAAADDNGVGVLLVEQHAAAALEVADRITVLRRGRIVHESGTASLRAAPEMLATLYLDDAPADGSP